MEILTNGVFMKFLLFIIAFSLMACGVEGEQTALNQSSDPQIESHSYTAEKQYFVNERTPFFLTEPTDQKAPDGYIAAQTSISPLDEDNGSFSKIMTDSAKEVFIATKNIKKNITCSD